jgi:hypothetical protein
VTLDSLCEAGELLIAETELSGRISVALESFNLNYRAWSEFNDSNAYALAFLGIDLSHSNFLTY